MGRNYMEDVGGAALVVYGCVLHALLIRWIVLVMYSGSSSSISQSHPAVAIIIALGGLYFWLFTRRALLPKNGQSWSQRSVAVVVGAGLRSSYAMALTFESFIVLLSVYLGLFSASDMHPTLMQKLGMVVLWFIDVQLIGAEAIAIGLPIAFIGGGLAGAARLALRSRKTMGAEGR